MAKKLFYILILIAAFAYIEAAIVVYLRHIYYPEGFHFPLRRHYDYILTIEVIREFSTLVILVTLSALFSTAPSARGLAPLSQDNIVSAWGLAPLSRISEKFWHGFGYFLYMFGLWDIFFYIWLKTTINWPVSIFDWDVLFLIPIPWLGPVIAPVSLSAIMIVIGVLIIRLFEKGYSPLPGGVPAASRAGWVTFKPGLIHWLMVLLGCGFILYSFINDWDAMSFEKYPKPYRYEFLVIGELLLIIPFVLLYRSVTRNGVSS
jgi:hypothetical protein